MALAFLLAAGFSACIESAPIPAMTVLPANGSTSGSPGTAVGWGFTLSYTAPSDWVVLTGSQFTGSQVYGSYVDYLSLSNAPLYVAGPSPESSVIQVAWNPFAKPPLGLGEFDINSTALVGANISGDLVVHYSVFSEDPNSPNFDPDTSTVVADATLSEAVQVNVSPEPASLWMISTALLLFAFVGWRHRKTPRSKWFE